MAGWRPTLALLATAAVLLACLGGPAAAQFTCTAKAADGSTVDLSGLTKAEGHKGIDTREKGKFIYHLNVCGLLTGVAGCEASMACQDIRDPAIHPDETGFPFQLGVQDSNLTFISPELPQLGLKLTYAGGDQCGVFARHTIIRFFCGSTAEGSPIFVEETDQCEYVFDWYTELACMDGQRPDDKLCETQDAQGNWYDLAPLSLTKDNWRAINPTTNEVYDFNICAPVNPEPNVQGECVGQAIKQAGCVSKNADPLYHKGLGHVATPTLSETGILFVEMHGGSLCDKAKGANVTRTTIITFACNPTAGIGQPVFVGEYLGCHAHFTWTTEYACPIKASTGKDCQVTDGQSGTLLDLRFLSLPVTATDGTHDYTISPCKTLPAANLCGTGAQACQTRADDTSFHFDIGSSPEHTVSIVAGDVVMQLENGMPCSRANRSAEISLLCDPKATVGSEKLVFVNEDDSCGYSFLLTTALVCPIEEEVIECTARDDKTGNTFDLNALTQETGNYFFVDSKQQRVVFNVCKPIVQTGGALKCDDTSAGCLLDSAVTTAKNGYGPPVGPTFAAVGGLGMTLKDDATQCSISINFECDIEAGTGEPKLVNEVGGAGCSYELEWVSSAACKEVRETGSSCRVANPYTKREYDLSAIKQIEEIKLTHPNYPGTTFFMSLCAPSKSCAPGVGSCLQKPDNSFSSLGHYSEAPLLTSDELVLEYTEAKCAEDATRMAITRILFICDPDADGSEVPELSTFSEDPCSVEYTWPTVHACDVVEAVPCKVEDVATGKVFDLTGLIKEDGNWIVPLTDSNGDPTGKTSEFNVCRNVNPTQAVYTCDPTSAACLVENNLATGTGLVAAPRYSARRGSVFLTYQGGDLRCNPGRIPSHTEIHLTCDEGAGLGFPTGREPDALCGVQLQWASAFGCPRPSVAAYADCKPQDANRGATYDLTQLTVATATDGDGNTYSFGGCGASAGCGGGAAVCLNGVTSLGKASADVAIFDGLVTASYMGGDTCAASTFVSDVRYFCDPAAGNGVPEFRSKSGCRYLFIWRTALVCPPTAQPLECVVTAGDGTVYDLRPLINDQANYRAEDTREGDKYDYELNVCRGLVQGASLCAPGQAVCQNAQSDHTGYGLGKPTEPRLTSDGALVIEYVLGDKPASDTACLGKPRSAVVEFECPRDVFGKPIGGIFGAPAFLAETESCEYLFKWRTSYACPLKEFTGDDCTVSDQLTGDFYSVAPLIGQQETWAFAADPQTDVWLSPCRGLKALAGMPTECEGKLLCVKEKDTQKVFSIGDKPGALSFFEDELFFEGTEIIMLCDRALSGNETRALSLIGSLATDYGVVWKTRLACPVQKYECTVNGNQGELYDLSELSRSDSNWIARDSRENNKYEYELNVCRPLVQQPGQPIQCPKSSASCQRRQEDEGHIRHDLGKVSSLLYDAENKRPYVEYLNGEVCYSGKRRRTRIDFYCSERSTLGGPVFLAEAQECEYRFLWETSAACSDKVRSSNDTLPVNLGSCSAWDSENGVKYDLSTLAGTRIEATNVNKDGNGDEYTYKLDVCTGFTCNGKANVGSCQITKDGTEYALGTVDSHFRVQDGIVTLNYIGGDSCTKDGKKLPRKTLIIFECDDSETDDSTTVVNNGIPKYVDETPDCTYVFSWKTKAVCPPLTSVPCVVYDPVTFHEYDLGLLTRLPEVNDANWLAVDTKTPENKHEYLLNVCKELISFADPEHRCYGAAACQLIDKIPAMNQHLGTVVQAPSFEDGKIILEYALPPYVSDRCHGKYERKVKITFTCKPGTLGVPLFVEETDDCTYHFDWATSAACFLRLTEGKNCKVQDSQTGLKFDISNVTQVSTGGLGYTINPCGGKGSCPPFTICNGNDRFTSDTRLYYGDGTLSQNFQGTPSTGACSGKKLNITINYYCNTEDRSNHVTLDFFDSDRCLLVFSWATYHACKNQQEVECIAVDAQGREYDLSPLALTALNQNHLVYQSEPDADYTFLINVCRDLNDQFPPTGCAPFSGACQIVTDQSKATAFNIGGIGKPTFEGSQLVARYTNGQFCGSHGARETVIRFFCSEPTDKDYPHGRPEYKGETETCLYEFDWYTDVACYKPPVVPPPPAAPSRAPSAGQQIGIIAGVAVVMVIIFVVIGVIMYRKGFRLKKMFRTARFNGVSHFYSAQDNDDEPDAWDED